MNHEESIRDMPIATDEFAWPAAPLDTVGKMRAIAAGLPYCAVRETVLKAPFEHVWDFIADLESSTPRFEGNVSKVQILERDHENLRIRSHTPAGIWFDADVVLRPGWCLMHSRFGQIGMAAQPEGDSRTRFIHFEGSPIFGRLVRPYLHWNIGADFRRLAAILE